MFTHTENTAGQAVKKNLAPAAQHRYAIKPEALSPFMGELQGEIIEYNGVTAEFKIIDKKIADAYLERNIQNRKMDKNRVEKYRADMLNGYWCLNGDAIRFDKNNNLIDGQNRLQAISQTNKSFVFLVIKNVEEKSKRTIDSGKSRSGGDILSMFANVGHRDAGSLSASINKIILYELALVPQPGGGTQKYTTNSCIEEFYLKNKEALHDSMAFIGKYIDTHAMLLSRSESIFLHYVFSKISKEESDVFMRKIITGANIEHGSNIFLLRSLLTKRAMKTLKRKPNDFLFTTIKAWNKDRKGGRYSNESNLMIRVDEGHIFAF